jgi:cell division septum initiation protein DivIVA
MDIVNIIDRLETLINTSKTMPMTSNIMVEKKKIMELVDQLRLTIPQEVKAAEEILNRKDSIINQAIADARHTKARAEEEFRERLDKSEILTHAQKRAEDILGDAEHRATRMLQQAEAEAHSRRTEADAFALQSLRALERELNTLSGSVRKGIDLLAGSAAINNNGNRTRE